MKIKVYLSKDNAVRLGLESYGELAVDLDIATLTQEQRDYLAPTQVSGQSLKLDHQYAEEGSMHWQLFPPTTEGVLNLLEFAVTKDRADREYGAKINAKRKAEAEADKKRADEWREKLVAYLLTLSDDDFLRQAANSWIGVPGVGRTIPNELILNDPRLQPQMERRNASLAERKRLDEAEKARRDAEVMAKAKRKCQQIINWVVEHGTDSQKRRFALKLLDEKEVVDALRDAAFQPLSEFHLYEKLTQDDVEHSETCSYEEEIEFSAENSYASDQVFAQLEQMITLLPDAAITPRVHEAKCRSCNAFIQRDSILAKLTVGEFEFTRDYTAPERVGGYVKPLPEEY